MAWNSSWWEIISKVPIPIWISWGCNQNLHCWDIQPGCLIQGDLRCSLQVVWSPINFSEGSITAKNSLYFRLWDDLGCWIGGKCAGSATYSSPLPVEAIRPRRCVGVDRAPAWQSPTLMTQHSDCQSAEPEVGCSNPLQPQYTSAWPTWSRPKYFWEGSHASSRARDGESGSSHRKDKPSITGKRIYCNRMSISD